jgi:hypothetical protein
VTSVRPATDGWHWKEWRAELAGTAVLLFAVVTAKYWAVRAGPPFSDPAIRVPIVGAVAALVVVGVAFSPLGRRSGAHLNPAVTIGMWLQKVTGSADLAGYVAAQIIGGIAGVAAARTWGPQVADATVRWAVIAPAAWHPTSWPTPIRRSGSTSSARSPGVARCRTGRQLAMPGHNQAPHVGPLVATSTRQMTALTDLRRLCSWPWRRGADCGS